MRTVRDLLDLSIHFICFSLHLSLIFSLFLLPCTFYFFNVVDNKPAHFPLRSLAPWSKTTPPQMYQNTSPHVMSENFRQFCEKKINRRSRYYPWTHLQHKNCKMKSIVWMSREIFKMLNQYAVDIPTLPINLCHSHLIQHMVECPTSSSTWWNAMPFYRNAEP